MDVPHDAMLLRIFTSVDDRWGVGPLYAAIVEKAREMHIAGATVLRGSIGFGPSGHLHIGRLFSLTADQPIVVEIVDSEEKIGAFLPVLDEMMESGLVTLEKAQVIQYGRQRAPLWQRLKEQFSGTHSASR
jgi:PII-like signaling protein